ncbi:MAG: GNAT family N-acetyltransferase [Hyphomonadaceae bacterium]|nr:GNAT family N-acetyltransferase [Hyphomonadaceae bacterium]
MKLRVLDPAEIAAHADALGAVLADCVEGGASVSFMAGLDGARAAAFWRAAAASAADDGRTVIVAEDETGVVGVVQLIPAGVENQPHRADVSKMLVHRRARRQGVAAALLAAVEAAARATGKTILVLDTLEGGDAERLYRRAGWTAAGVIPDYALTPDGRPWATVVFWKRVA